MATDSKVLNQISLSTEEGLSLKFRLLGLLPLAFFTAHFWFYWKNGGLDNMFWMCNVGNLALAAGILLGQRWMIRPAVIWLIPGLPLWLFEVVRHGGWLLTSFFTHIGGLAVGIVAIYKVRADKRTWGYALGWYWVMQLLSWLFTDPFWNVNVAHRIYGGYETIVSEYWQFWILTTLMVAAGLWILGWILLKLFPPNKKVIAVHKD